LIKPSRPDQGGDAKLGAERASRSCYVESRASCVLAVLLKR